MIIIDNNLFGENWVKKKKAVWSYSYPSITFPCSQVHFNYYSSSLVCINRRAFGILMLCLFLLALICIQGGYDRTQQMGCFSSLSHFASL